MAIFWHLCMDDRVLEWLISVAVRVSWMMTLSHQTELKWRLMSSVCKAYDIQFIRSLYMFKFGKFTHLKFLSNKTKVYEIRLPQKAATIKRWRGSHMCFVSLWSGDCNKACEWRERHVWYKRLGVASDGFVPVSRQHGGRWVWRHEQMSSHRGPYMSRGYITGF